VDFLHHRTDEKPTTSQSLQLPQCTTGHETAPGAGFLSRRRARAFGFQADLIARQGRQTLIELDVKKNLMGSEGPFDLSVHAIIEKNEIAAVSGASGAAKTTLLRLVAGLEKPDDGASDARQNHVEESLPFRFAESVRGFHQTESRPWMAD
jgi:hypothetical protein